MIAASLSTPPADRKFRVRPAATDWHLWRVPLPSVAEAPAYDEAAWKVIDFSRALYARERACERDALRRPCPCAHCAPTSSRAKSDDPDLADEHRRPLPIGPFGVRKPGEPSRYLEIRALERLRVKDANMGRSPGGHPAPDMPPMPQPYFIKRTARPGLVPADASRARVQLSPADERDALAILRVWSAFYFEKKNGVDRTRLAWVGGREDWMHGVWIELVNPPAGIKEASDLKARVRRAVWRFEKRQKMNMRLVDFRGEIGPTSLEE